MNSVGLGFFAGLVLAAGGVSAQTLTSLRVEPALARPGEAVRATLDFELQGGITHCNVLLKWGDGSSENAKINQSKDVPMVLSHSYARSGVYTVTAEPKTNLPLLKCLGKNRTASVTVAATAAPAAAAAAPPPAASPAGVCPPGWTLVKPGVSKKTGAYACSARAGTPVPEPRLVCRGELTYFENIKKGRLGCQP